jgi:hypothetical protein
MKWKCQQTLSNDSAKKREVFFSIFWPCALRGLLANLDVHTPFIMRLQAVYEKGNF